jgi:hypothetical protein
VTRTGAEIVLRDLWLIKVYRVRLREISSFSPMEDCSEVSGKCCQTHLIILMLTPTPASRPSHYLVLKDDNFNFIVDEYGFCKVVFSFIVILNDSHRLQELSFALCHVYAKATRSVSIPAPVYCELPVQSTFIKY